MRIEFCILTLRNHQDVLSTNKKLAYTLIFSKFCHKELQFKIKSLEEFKKIENDPLKLLETIKTIMHLTLHEKLVFPYETLWTTLAQLFCLKQDEDEKFVDYYNNFKAFSQQARKYLNSNTLDNFTTTL